MKIFFQHIVMGWELVSNLEVISKFVIKQFKAIFFMVVTIVLP